MIRTMRAVAKAQKPPCGGHGKTLRGRDSVGVHACCFDDGTHLGDFGSDEFLVFSRLDPLVRHYHRAQAFLLLDELRIFQRNLSASLIFF